MALETSSPIVPTLIIGAEETHVNLTQWKPQKLLGGVRLPIPLNFFPLPVKWKIKFLPPIQLDHGPETEHDQHMVRSLARQIRKQMQEELHKELKKRKSLFV